MKYQIKKRVDFFRLRIERNQVIQLNGSIDKEGALQQHIPKSIISVFLYGFPRLWKQHCKVVLLNASRDIDASNATHGGTRGLNPEKQSQQQHLPSSAASIGTQPHEWTQGQLQELMHAERMMDTAKPCFWHKVAKKVSGKNPQECQQKWFEYFQSPVANKKPGARKQQQVSSGAAVSSDHQHQSMGKLAGPKTKKFQKQVRTFVQEMEKNHSDDIFGQAETPGKETFTNLLYDAVTIDSSPLGINRASTAISSLSTSARAIPPQESSIIEEENGEMIHSPGMIRYVSDDQRDYLHSYINLIRKNKDKRKQKACTTTAQASSSLGTPVSKHPLANPAAVSSASFECSSFDALNFRLKCYDILDTETHGSRKRDDGKECRTAGNRDSQRNDENHV